MGNTTRATGAQGRRKVPKTATKKSVKVPKASLEAVRAKAAYDAILAKMLGRREAGAVDSEPDTSTSAGADAAGPALSDGIPVDDLPLPDVGGRDSCTDDDGEDQADEWVEEPQAEVFSRRVERHYEDWRKLLPKLLNAYRQFMNSANLEDLAKSSKCTQQGCKASRSTIILVNLERTWLTCVR